MKHILRIVVLLAGVSFASGWADQNAPALDGLFQQLQSSDTSDSQARDIIAQIWNHWLAREDPKANSLMKAGIEHMNHYELDDAILVFTNLVRIAPDFAEAWNKRATVYYMRGEYGKSTADVRETLRLEPRHFGALSGQGLIYLELGRETEALHWFRLALDVNPFMSAIRQNVRMLEQKLEGKLI